MLWKKPYSPRKLDVQTLGVLTHLLPDDHRDALIIGGINPNFVLQGRTWMKLAHSQGLGDLAKWALVQQRPSPTDMTSYFMALPPSEHSFAFAIHDESGEFLRQLGDLSERDSFALVVRNGAPVLAYLGAPTEEVWEEAENALKGSKSTDPSQESQAQ
ncbi:MAG: hypothetical protein ACK4P3_02920 [Fimbriimonadaceae bacterium]